MRTVAIAAIAAFALSGCYTFGTQVSQADASRFKTGVTTESDVVRALGQPQSTARLPDGTRVLTYAWTQAHIKGTSFIPFVGLFAGGVNSEGDEVTLAFGSDGKLSNVSSTHSNTDAHLYPFGGNVRTTSTTNDDTRSRAATAPAPAQPISAVIVPAQRVVGASFGPNTMGISVLQVDKNSVAAHAGLRSGDLITQINGRNIAALYWENAVALLTRADASVSVRLVGNEERILTFPQ